MRHYMIIRTSSSIDLIVDDSVTVNNLCVHLRISRKTGFSLNRFSKMRRDAPQNRSAKQNTTQSRITIPFSAMKSKWEALFVELEKFISQFIQFTLVGTGNFRTELAG